MAFRSLLKRCGGVLSTTFRNPSLPCIRSPASPTPLRAYSQMHGVKEEIRWSDTMRRMHIRPLRAYSQMHGGVKKVLGWSDMPRSIRFPLVFLMSVSAGAMLIISSPKPKLLVDMNDIYVMLLVVVVLLMLLNKQGGATDKSMIEGKVKKESI